MFPGMDEYRFATFLVCAQKEKIQKELDIDELYTDMAIKIVYKYILKNKKIIQSKFTNQYDCLFDTDFFWALINLLKKAKNQGIPLKIDL